MRLEIADWFHGGGESSENLLFCQFLKLAFVKVEVSFKVICNIEIYVLYFCIKFISW